MSDKLKPCPCGGQLELFVSSYRSCYIICDKCYKFTEYKDPIVAVTENLARPAEDEKVAVTVEEWMSANAPKKATE